MGLPITPEDVAALSLDERLDLIGMIWDSLRENDVEPTEAQKAELERRLAAHKANPDDVVSWEAVLAEARSGAKV